MRLNARALLAIFALCVIGFSTYALTMEFAMPFVIPHGYDGVVATTLGVEHDYPTVREKNTGLYMGIDPYGEITLPGVEHSLQTGLNVEIASCQYVPDSAVDKTPNIFKDVVTEDGVKYNRTITQKVTKMVFEINMDLETYGEGLSKISDVTFWVRLKNNDYSIFTNPDDVAVAIVNVYNIERPYIAQEGKTIEFVPSASGGDFPLYEVEGAELTDFPLWADEYYNLANLQILSDVMFPLHVIEAQPTTELPFDLGERVECQVEFIIGVDVWVFGEWRELRPYREVEWPDPELTWWEQFTGWIDDVWTGFVEFISSPVGMAYSILILVIVVGVIVIIIRMFVRRGG